MPEKKNLMPGEKFGMLTVVEEAAPIKTPRGTLYAWRCVCDCGNERIVTTSKLVSGNTSSCGCIKYKRKLLDKDNLLGMRFGRLTVIEYCGVNRASKRMWKCRCDCGNETVITAHNLKSGASESCGCLREDVTRNRVTKHGKSHRSRLYNVWVGMRERCNNPNHISYHLYGGIGITVCEDWADFSCFEKWAIDNGYNPTAPRGECTLDRIDPYGNYSPENCRWVPMSVQSNNKRK